MAVVKANLKIFSMLWQSFLSCLRLNSFYNLAYLKALQDVSTNTLRGDIKSQNEFYNRWLSLSDIQLDRVLRTDDFISSLSKYVSSIVELWMILRESGYPIYYISWLFDSLVRNTLLFFSIQKDFQLTDFTIEYKKDKIRLLHYLNNSDTDNSNYDAANRSKNEATEDKRNDDIIRKTTKTKQTRIPVLIVYAPINRFHIMDVSPDKSVVKNLLSSKLDVFLLDWGYPNWEDAGLSLNDYVNYVKDAVRYIKEKSLSCSYSSSAVAAEQKNDIINNNKISIIGYCWGGVIAPIYTSLYNKDIQSLTLMAVPIDFSKDETILADWARVIDSDKIIDEFSHINGQFLDIGFLMRNPLRYTFDKYLNMLKRSADWKFINNLS